MFYGEWVYFHLKPLDVLVTILPIYFCGLKATVYVCNYGFRFLKHPETGAIVINRSHVFSEGHPQSFDTRAKKEFSSKYKAIPLFMTFHILLRRII